MGYKDVTSGTIYLGYQLVFAKNRTKEFGKLKDSVQSRMEGWKNHLPSHARKATLIKSIIHAIPQY